MRGDGDTDLNGDLIVRHKELAPGTTCVVCGTRKPHPRKDSTPVTRTVAKRIPVDEFDAHEEVAQAAAEHLGVHDRPYWRYQLDTFAYAVVLQDASLKDVGRAS